MNCGEVYNIRSTNSITFGNDINYTEEHFKLITSQPVITHSIAKSLANNIKIAVFDNYIVAESIGGSNNLQKVLVYDIVRNQVGIIDEANAKLVKIPVPKEGVYIVKVSIGNKVIY